MTPPNPLDLELVGEMLTFIQSCFRQERDMLLKTAGQIAFTEKGDGSPATEADIAVENRITQAFTQRFPGIPILGEEAGYDNDLPELCWLLDPIDGTKSFISNKPFFTSMATLIADKKPVACVIYNPSTDEMFTAQEGQGAFRNNQRLDLTAMPLPAVADCKEGFVADLNNIMANTTVECAILSNGAAGHSFSAVAAGTSAARFQIGSRGYPHDYAPGILLITEARGKIIPLIEVEVPYMLRTFVACHPALAPFVREHASEILALDT